MNRTVNLLEEFYAKEEHPLRDDQEIIAPFTHVLRTPGKNIRYAIVKAFNRWLNISEENAKEFAIVGEVLHNASLLIDDVQDHSALRRGIPAAHHVYGVPRTINSAYYVVLLGFKRIVNQSSNPLEATAHFVKQLVEIHSGQGLEIYWRDHFHCPTEEEYCMMVNKSILINFELPKLIRYLFAETGSAFRLIARLMQIFSTSKCDLEPFIYKFALLFQITDDYKNLTTDHYHKFKGFAEDLTEGKFGFPLIHCIKNFPEEGKEVLYILRQQTEDLELKKRAICLLKKCGSLDYTLKTINNLRVAVEEDIKKLGKNPAMEELVGAVVKEVIV